MASIGDWAFSNADVVRRSRNLFRLCHPSLLALDRFCTVDTKGRRLFSYCCISVALDFQAVCFVYNLIFNAKWCFCILCVHCTWAVQMMKTMNRRTAVSCVALCATCIFFITLEVFKSAAAGKFSVPSQRQSTVCLARVLHVRRAVKSSIVGWRAYNTLQAVP